MPKRFLDSTLSYTPPPSVKPDTRHNITYFRDSYGSYRIIDDRPTKANAGEQVDITVHSDNSFSMNKTDSIYVGFAKEGKESLIKELYSDSEREELKSLYDSYANGYVLAYTDKVFSLTMPDRDAAVVMAYVKRNYSKA